MSSGSALEANFVRLLHCTESLTTSTNPSYDEFLPYYKKLRELLFSLTNSNLRPAAEFLHLYKTRVDQLSDFCNRYQELKSDDASETKTEFEKNMHKWLRCDPKPTSWGLGKRKAFFFPLDHSAPIKWLDQDAETCTNKQVSAENMVENQVQRRTKSKPSMTRYISDVPNPHRRLRNLDEQQIRKSLGLDGKSETNAEAKPNDLLDVEILERDKIAESMLSLAEELRSTQMALGDRIRADIGVLSSSSTVAQANAESLASVSRRVREELGQKFGLYVWIFFLLSLVVFFWMVLFIKFTPKGTRS